jgi:hypothetical protein
VKVLAFFCTVFVMAVKQAVRDRVGEPKPPNQHPREQYQGAHGFKGTLCEKHTESRDGSTSAAVSRP